jgi:ElaB/YqjD/DUF883 family membrane-anchored ribosome-binding protein
MDKELPVKEAAETVEAVDRLIDQSLNKVEAQIDSTVDSAKEAVHEMRSEAQKAADRTLDRFSGFWQRTQQKLDTQMELHPWVVLGALLVVGYLLHRSQRPEPRSVKME